MSTDLKNIKVVLVHDWLLNIGGAEKVLKALHEIFPQAPIYTLFYDKKFTDNFLPEADIRPTFLQKLYRVLGSHKLLTPLMPLAIESLDLSDFDLVISSSVAFSKGLILKPQTVHVCYCYSPTRQLWDWHAEYRAEPHKSLGAVTSLTQHFLRIWDRHASSRVDYFIAISENVRRRIKKYYQRDSTVIYPPVSTPLLFPDAKYAIHDSEYFLIVSRLYKHKNIDIAIRAFNKLGWPLVIIGDGPEFKRLKKMAEPNVKLLGYQPDDIVCDYYANCIAFVMPQEEDFGIAPLEAMNYGKPVLALRCGGALEYVQEGTNGEFFDSSAEEVLADGARRIKEGIGAKKYNSEIIKKTAEKFSAERFRNEFIKVLGPALTQ